MSIEAKYFFQIKTDANRYRTVSNPPRTVNRTEACVPRYTVKRYIVSPLLRPAHKVIFKQYYTLTSPEKV